MLFAAITSALAAPWTFRIAAAQDGMLPCPSMMNVVGGDVDRSIGVSGSAELLRAANPASGGPQSDEVRLSWELTGSPNCVWIQRAGPGAEFTALADFVIPTDRVDAVDRPGPLRGQYCYRFFVVSDAGRSEPSQSCLAIEHPRLPMGPHGEAPAPPDTGTGPGSGSMSLAPIAVGIVLIGSALVFLTPRRSARRQ